jgi:uncharacterized membrane protein
VVVGKEQLIQAIQAAEKETSGEIRVHLSTAGDEENILDAAKASFGALGMHQTKDRNGILLYFNTKLKKFAVFGDEGIHQKVGQGFWEGLSAEIRRAILEKDLTAAIVHAIQQTGQALKEHFPLQAGDRNELSNDITQS